MDFKIERLGAYERILIRTYGTPIRRKASKEWRGAVFDTDMQPSDEALKRHAVRASGRAAKQRARRCLPSPSRSNGRNFDRQGGVS